MSDATTALLRAITVNFMNFAPVFERVRSRDWASGTFAGTRHALTIRLEGEAAADAFLRDLEEAEFQLRGHILADISLVSRERTSDAEGPLVRIALEALTVEES